MATLTLLRWIQVDALPALEAPLTLGWMKIVSTGRAGLWIEVVEPHHGLAVQPEPGGERLPETLVGLVAVVVQVHAPLDGVAVCVASDDGPRAGSVTHGRQANSAGRSHVIGASSSSISSRHL